MIASIKNITIQTPSKRSKLSLREKRSDGSGYEKRNEFLSVSIVKRNDFYSLNKNIRVDQSPLVLVLIEIPSHCIE